MICLFRCCDTDRNPTSQGYGGIILQATSLLVFRVGSFEKLNFSIRSSLCQAKIYQGIPGRHKFRIRSHKVSIIQFNLLFMPFFQTLFNMLLICTVVNFTVLFFSSPPLILSYLSTQWFYSVPILLLCFLSQNILKCIVLQPMSLSAFLLKKKKNQPKITTP